jgi:hypothetical protein
MGRRGYPPKFRRKILDLVAAGRPIAEVAKARGISAQSISTWRLQDRIATGWLLAQTDQRLAGNQVIPDRLVSLSDLDARPIRKGKPTTPTQFGYSLLVAEEERGFIADTSSRRRYSSRCIAWWPSGWLDGGCGSAAPGRPSATARSSTIECVGEFCGINTDKGCTTTSVATGSTGSPPLLASTTPPSKPSCSQPSSRSTASRNRLAPRDSTFHATPGPPTP